MYSIACSIVMFVSPVTTVSPDNRRQLIYWLHIKRKYGAIDRLNSIHVVKGGV